MTANWHPDAKLRRSALIEWCSRPGFTHAITLAPNRKNVSSDLLKSMFGAFCCEVDRFMLGTKNVQRRFTIERLEAIAFPEMLEGNPHLHCVANFSRTHWQHRLDQPWQAEMPKIWKRVTRDAGELHMELRRSEGWGRYVTKEHFRPGHDFFLAADFHSSDYLRDYKLDTVLAKLK